MTMEFTPPRAAILAHLRHTPHARYRDLMHAAGLESDVFKFHVRYLVEQGAINKQADGTYVLTPAGKEIANNLNESAQKQLKQPKLSLLLVITRQTPGGTEYLVQKRLRHPFYGYWGLLSGPAQWGEDFATTAAHELHKQTGLTADVQVCTFLRQRDYSPTTELLEDKLFVVLTAQAQTSELPPHTWQHGQSAWMTLPQLQAQPLHFALTEQAVQAAQAGIYANLTNIIDPTTY